MMSAIRTMFSSDTSPLEMAQDQFAACEVARSAAEDAYKTDPSEEHSERVFAARKAEDLARLRLEAAKERAESERRAHEAKQRAADEVALAALVERIKRWEFSQTELGAIQIPDRHPAKAHIDRLIDLRRRMKSEVDGIREAILSQIALQQEAQDLAARCGSSRAVPVPCAGWHGADLLGKLVVRKAVHDALRADRLFDDEVSEWLLP